MNIEDNFDIKEQNQEEHNESIDIREDQIDQAIITDDDLDISLSDYQESSIEKNNDIISLSSIDENNSSSYEDKDEYFSKKDETNNEDDETNNKDDEINNEVEKFQYNKTYNLTEALPLEHYEENDYDINKTQFYSPIVR